MLFFLKTDSTINAKNDMNSFLFGSNSFNLAMISFGVIGISFLLCSLNQHNNLSSIFKVD